MKRYSKEDKAWLVEEWETSRIRQIKLYKELSGRIERL
jgi:hypothetical protein